MHTVMSDFWYLPTEAFLIQCHFDWNTSFYIVFTILCNISTSLSSSFVHNCISFTIQYHHIPLTLLKSAAYKWIMSLSQPPWGKTVIKTENSEVCQNGRQSSMACLFQQRCQSKARLNSALKGTDSLCQEVPKTAYWNSNTKFHLVRLHQPLVTCGCANRGSY